MGPTGLRYWPEYGTLSIVMPSQSKLRIVLAKLVDDFAVVKPGQPDIGRPAVLAETKRAVACMWKLGGTEKDLEAARKFAPTEGYTVFVYPISERKPLERAKADIAKA